MSLTPQEAFKIGFLCRCADEGLLAAAVDERIQKAAAFAEKVAGSWTDYVPGGQTVSDLTGLGLRGALTAGLVAPVAVGALGGWGLHKATENPTDAEDVKNQELMDAYRRFAREATERTKHKQLRQSISL